MQGKGGCASSRGAIRVLAVVRLGAAVTIAVGGIVACVCI